MAWRQSLLEEKAEARERYYDQSSTSNKPQLHTMVEPGEKVGEVLQPDGWNDYQIRCQGPLIQFWLNGTAVLEYIEEDDSIDRSGILCVQIHGGPPAEAWYKDIEVREL